jgi:xanthine phosphoribosyltransferase
MQKLKDKILKEGKILKGNIVKVDSFLNHQIDTSLMSDIGAEFYRRFKNEKVTKILTIESSGIAIALLTGIVFNMPVVFAKKHKPAFNQEDCYTSNVYSFTRKTEYEVSVSKEYIGKKDSILIIDDFLATGSALNGLIDITEKSGAKIAGVGIVIEKVFQKGGESIRNRGIKLSSLAKIKSIGTEGIEFED